MVWYTNNVRRERDATLDWNVRALGQRQSKKTDWRLFSLALKILHYQLKEAGAILIFCLLICFEDGSAFSNLNKTKLE